MTISLKRRTLLAAAALPIIPTAFARRPLTPFERIEARWGGRLGVAAIDTGTGEVVGNRRDERFPFCSTFKSIVAAAVLARSVGEPGFLDKRLRYTQADIKPHSPVSEKHVDGGMTAAELCAATIQYSDNAAANILMRELGGPAAITAYARTLGDTTFRLDRWETELNTAIPGDERDTTTPLAMARTLQKLLVEDGLPPAQQRQLKDWMVGNTTGDTRIRAGVPKGATVADKTGTAGSYGVANDIGVVYLPERAPIVLAVFTHSTDERAEARSEIVAEATSIALKRLDPGPFTRPR
ncbi:class A beta-lactamase [Pseudoduganella chitinolytica]|uniref:Beta-lactamase n=1 Tax=Pseudoduganella chitinolytica TaxID=34070 RepID=A0ABY8BL13_9BURK|nr:class A beta-lactamase [Pseudoduganella chitinolytica]WEF35059.1 class A beta-lactamase [Pseudoduganella chitinolytica]